MFVQCSKYVAVPMFCWLPLLAADTCDTVAGATLKLPTMAVHIYTTETSAAFKGPRESESIFTGGPNGPVYIKIQGKWRRSPAKPSDMISAREDGRAKDKPSCRYVRDEAVNGEAAAVYSSHQEDPTYKIDTTIWVSKSRNVPLRSEADVDVGGAMGKSHRSTRYDYNAVTAPPGVQ